MALLSRVEHMAKRGNPRYSICFYGSEKCFSLVELLIVITILAILSVISVPNLSTFSSAGKIAMANTELSNVETAAEAYYAENRAWPSNTNGDLVNVSYFRSTALYDYSFNSFVQSNMADGSA